MRSVSVATALALIGAALLIGIEVADRLARYMGYLP